MENDLQEKLALMGVDKSFHRIGLDVAMLFADSKKLQENPYRNHHWVVKENGGFLVVNAIPSKEDQDHLFWEEWYLHAGEVHHHILSLWEPSVYQEVFQAPACDDIHPAQCFGSRWFVIEDVDMRPLLLRR